MAEVGYRFHVLNPYPYMAVLANGDPRVSDTR